MDRTYMKSVAMSGLFKYLPLQNHQAAWRELHMTPRSYGAGQVIYGQEEPVYRAAIVHSGLVKGERLHSEGTSSLAYYYGRGEMFAFEGALSGKKTAPMQLTADSDTSVIFFDVQQIFTSSFQQELVQGLMELLANDDIKKLYRIEILAKRGLRDRILSHFRVLAAKSGGVTFTLRMSRQQLADYLCVNRSALSNELNRMKREGLIDFQNKTYTLLK